MTDTERKDPEAEICMLRTSIYELVRYYTEGRDKDFREEVRALAGMEYDMHDGQKYLDWIDGLICMVYPSDSDFIPM